MVQSYIVLSVLLREWLVAWSIASSLLSGPALCGPVQQWVLYPVIVGLVFKYPGGMPGDRRTWFSVVWSYVVWSGSAVGDSELG